MGWCHPDISLEDLLKLVKGFIDILILASGYQSSGHLAHWDSHNIKKAFQWSIFFETVLDQLSCYDDYQESVQEFDAALSELKSNPYFPKGLSQITFMTLRKARSFLLEHLIQTLPLREENLKAVMTAAIEMDFDHLGGKHSDQCRLYLEKSMGDASINPLLPRRKLFANDPALLAADCSPSSKDDNGVNGVFSTLTVQELGRRQSAVSCVYSAERGLDVLLKSLMETTLKDSKNMSYGEEGKQPIAVMAVERPVQPVTWSAWKARSLSYLLDNRTIRLVSGASLMITTSKSQLVHVFETLDVSTGAQGDSRISEVVELLLIGCVSGRWNTVIERLMSTSYQSVTISKLYHEVQNMSFENIQNLSSKEGTMDVKEKDYLEYLEAFMGNKVHHLWKLSPTLAAISIPFWSQLFRSYLKELERQLTGDPSTIRCCNCLDDRKEHRECEVAERVWCLYTFVVPQLNRTTGMALGGR